MKKLLIGLLALGSISTFAFDGSNCNVLVGSNIPTIMREMLEGKGYEVSENYSRRTSKYILEMKSIRQDYPFFFCDGMRQAGHAGIILSKKGRMLKRIRSSKYSCSDTSDYMESLAAATALRKMYKYIEKNLEFCQLN